jgi:hypothetical protein
MASGSGACEIILCSNEVVRALAAFVFHDSLRGSLYQFHVSFSSLLIKMANLLSSLNFLVWIYLFFKF